MSRALRIDVWSDIACPWCYVGKRRLEGALAGFEHRSSVEVVWRAFELDPAAPRSTGADPSVSYPARLARKYGTSTVQAEAMIARMTAVGHEDALDFHFERVKPGNTFDAHRLLHLAHDRGIQDAVKERLLRAYMTEGVALGDADALVRVTAEAGLDADEARAVLQSDRYEREVRADEAAARDRGVNGVPFFLVGGLYAVAGAQPVETLRFVLDKAWKQLDERDASAAEASATARATVCGPDGCA